VIKVTETTSAYVEQQREAAGTECHFSGTGVTLQYRKMERGSETKIHNLFPKIMEIFIYIMLTAVIMRGFYLMPNGIFFLIW
jgi:hypothetical protein